MIVLSLSFSAPLAPLSSPLAGGAKKGRRRRRGCAGDDGEEKGGQESRKDSDRAGGLGREDLTRHAGWGLTRQAGWVDTT